MNRVIRVVAVAAAFGAAVMAGGAARADNIVARWIQIAPGSSSEHPTITNFGDAPLTLPHGNTVLARAIISDITQGCPVARLDHYLPLKLEQRFDPSTLAGTALYPAVGPVPGTTGKTNGKNGYPQYFINAAATASSTLPGPNGTTVPQATSLWTECEAIVPPGHSVATIGGVDLKLPVAHPQRIMVFGDTGCRMNGVLAANGSNQQNCMNPSAFALQYLSTYEATFRPDLILQVGDWFYRDTNCQNTFAGCGSPTSATYETWGDTFDSWNADVFFPEQASLAAAPWVMLRGNHESCGRGARGWFAFLDPHPYNVNNVKCPFTAAYPAPGGTAENPTPTYNADFTPTFIVPINNVKLLAHDSSFANDSASFAPGSPDINTAKNYDIDLTNALNAVGDRSIAIFATHKPTFGLTYGSITGTNNNTGDFTEQAVFSGGTWAGSAFTNGVPSRIGLFLSGHVHQLQYLVGPTNYYPPQLIVGVGGSLLDADMNTGIVPSGITDVASYSQISTPTTQWTFTVNKFDGTKPTVNFSHNYSHDEFGFAVLDAVNDLFGNTTGYVANVYKISTNHSGRCTITLGNGFGQKRSLACNF